MRKRIGNPTAIRVFRQATGLSQSAFAPKVDITQGYLSQIESGDKAPSPELLRRLAVTLDVPLAAISMVLPDCPSCGEELAA